MENFESLLSALPSPISLLDQMDHALLLVAERQERADEFISVDLDIDFPLLYVRDGRECQYLFEQVHNRNVVHLQRTAEGFFECRLTPTGWEEVQRLQSLMPDSNQAFVAMWFHESTVDAWQNGLDPALRECGYDPVRIDMVRHNDRIDHKIVAEIRRSGLLVADFTGNRQGVYFEAGYARGLGIPVISTCQAQHASKLHFDTRQFFHILWKDPDNLRTELVDQIRATIPGRAR